MKLPHICGRFAGRPPSAGRSTQPIPEALCTSHLNCASMRNPWMMSWGSQALAHYKASYPSTVCMSPTSKTFHPAWSHPHPANPIDHPCLSLDIPACEGEFPLHRPREIARRPDRPGRIPCFGRPHPLLALLRKYRDIHGLQPMIEPDSVRLPAKGPAFAC